MNLASFFVLLTVLGCANGAPNRSSRSPDPSTRSDEPAVAGGPTHSGPATPGAPPKTAEPGATPSAAGDDSLIRGRSQGEAVTLSGFLFHYPADGSYQLCDHMCESYPPQCCGPHVPLVDVGDKAPKLSTAEHNDSVEWTDSAVTLNGTVDGDAVSVAKID